MEKHALLHRREGENVLDYWSSSHYLIQLRLRKPGVGEIAGREAAALGKPAMRDNRLQRLNVIPSHPLDSRAMVHCLGIIPGQLQSPVDDAGVYFQQMSPRR